MAAATLWSTVSLGRYGAFAWNAEMRPAIERGARRRATVSRVGGLDRRKQSAPAPCGVGTARAAGLQSSDDTRAVNLIHVLLIAISHVLYSWS